MVAGLVGARGHADRARGAGIPSLFALTYEGFGNLQMALFAAFGGFANLVVASFGGSRRDKAIAHFGLAADREPRPDHRHRGQRDQVAGRPGHDPGGVRHLLRRRGGPERGVGGHRRAVPLCAVGGHARHGEHDRGPAGGLVAGLGGGHAWPCWCSRRRRRATGCGPRRSARRGRWPPRWRRSATARPPPATIEACQAAKQELISAFDSTPFRPTGLATADQAMASVVQYLEWCTALIADATDGHPNLDRAAQPDRDLLAETAVVLRQIGGLLADRDGPRAARRRRAGTAARGQRRLPPVGGRGRRDYDSVEAAARYAFHAQAISLAVRGLARTP